MNKLTIDWNLGNSCDLKCSYCSPVLHDGTNPFPNIDKFVPAFDHLINQTRDFSRVDLEFSGGEPTSSDAIKHVILQNTDSRIKFKLISNGQAPINWWEEVVDHLYDLTLTYHAGTSFDHFLILINIVQHLKPKVYIAITPQSWTIQKTVYDTLKKLGHDVHLQLLYSNFTKGNNEYLKYSDEQWNDYFKEIGIDPTVSKQVESTIEFKRVNKLNNFYGHLCWAGVNQFIIDNFGDAWRGWCKSNKCLGNVFDKTLVLDQRPQVCPKIQCRNGFDLQARKSEGSWGMS